MKKANIAIDGASKGNPGPAGIGVVICDESGNIVREIGEYIGETTNNIAEYSALLRALSEAVEMGFTDLSIQTDSELMAKQINGQYRVKNEGIIPLYESARSLLRKFDSASIKHVLRENNKLADALASKAAMYKGQPTLALEEKKATPAPAKKKTTEVGMIRQVEVRTSARTQFLDITSQVQDAVKASGISDGICTVFVPHTTAGITINENADPDVTADIIDTLNRLVPQSPSYRHIEGNADSHVKASMMGFSVQVFVQNGRLELGTWQAIYFCEFDGPRSRHVLVRVG